MKPHANLAISRGVDSHELTLSSGLPGSSPMTVLINASSSWPPYAACKPTKPIETRGMQQLSRIQQTNTWPNMPHMFPLHTTTQHTWPGIPCLLVIRSSAKALVQNKGILLSLVPEWVCTWAPKARGPCITVAQGKSIVHVLLACAMKTGFQGN
eukprot:1157119-Pelagomonas_calceolata.AAC.1